MSYWAALKYAIGQFYIYKYMLHAIGVTEMRVTPKADNIIITFSNVKYLINVWLIAIGNGHRE